jgi:hypothetical protein
MRVKIVLLLIHRCVRKLPKICWDYWSNTYLLPHRSANWIILKPYPRSLPCKRVVLHISDVRLVAEVRWSRQTRNGMHRQESGTGGVSEAL